MRLRVAGQICPSREVLAQQAVRVLIAAALPWAAGIAEVDCTLVATVKVLWSAISLPRSHVNDRRSSRGNLRTCLLSAPTTVAVSSARDLDQHCEARMALGLWLGAFAALYASAPSAVSDACDGPVGTLPLSTPY